jgi:hypothetical protein
MDSEELNKANVGDVLVYKDTHEVTPYFRGRGFKIVGFRDSGLYASPVVDVTGHDSITGRKVTNLNDAEYFGVSSDMIGGRVFVINGSYLIDSVIGRTKKALSVPEKTSQSKNPHGWSDDKYAQMKFFGYGKGFQGDGGNKPQFP